MIITERMYNQENNADKKAQHLQDIKGYLEKLELNNFNDQDYPNVLCNAATTLWSTLK